ncbi:MAG: alpha-D-ribose 1-methylphosphonate 5-triphosphate diphosphatase [Pseudomonadota bacterium]
MSLEARLTGAKVLLPDGVSDKPLSFAEGVVVEDAQAKEVDLSGFMVMPGIVDVHGDAFEKHLAPRRGAMKDVDQGLIAAEAELAANGITTGTLAQFYSWEGGMRGPEFAERVFEGLEKVRPRLGTDLRVQLRFEVSMLDDYEEVRKLLDRFNIGYLVFNDHLPHDALAQGKTPPGHVGKSLRIGKNPDKHLEYIHSLHAGMDKVPAALDAFCETLRKTDIRIGSHDETSAEQRATWHARGAHVSEFPETLETAEAAKSTGDSIVLGAPNLVRGGSHKGNVSALELVTMGLCDALASDYHYPSLRRAAFMLERSGVCDRASAWALISSGPAKVLGLEDRGELTPGLRADMVILDEDTRDICATLSAGEVTYMKGELAARFMV